MKIDNIKIEYNNIIILILICTAYATFKYYQNGYSSSEIRVLISTLLYSSISFPKKIRYKTLILITTISSIYISYQTINIIEIKNLSRYELPLNAIPYANFLGLLSLITLYLSYISKSRALSAISVFNFILLSINVVLVDTRGTWLALIIAYVAIIAIIFIRKKSWKITLISIFLFSTIAILSYPVIESRIDRSMTEIKQLKEGDLHSSWGIRLQLWIIGYNIIEDNKSWLGLGQTAHLKIIDDLLKKKEVLRALNWFDNKNFHNSIIDRTVKYGFIGTFLYFLVLLIPFIHGIRHFRSNYSPLLLIMPIFIFSAGLSYIPLSHPGTYFLYLFTSIILINKIKLEKEK
ncbi:O-antigen ligase family protein [Vibrio cyclitrophicus]|uniref:O-antigen ligase family protein n=1 Tax=Vibrio cyclitrophicus TaxID=47951 RepID=UPI001E480753|nr:O-antigen ligase family protein [Vibrio cyclitrophicus]